MLWKLCTDRSQQVILAMHEVSQRDASSGGFGEHTHTRAAFLSIEENSQAGSQPAALLKGFQVFSQQT